MTEPTLQRFFDTLFDPEESTCFAKHKQGTKVYPVIQYGEIRSWANLFCINPLHPTEDLSPHESYHAASRPRRCDQNVVAFRNILIEMDKLPLNEQDELIAASEIPYSAAVYSGGKSIHWVISLETPLKSEHEYREVVSRVHEALGGKQNVDVSCKNPSRLSRFPEAVRHDAGGTIQSLLTVKGRVSNRTFFEWLDQKAPIIKLNKPKKPYLEVPISSSNCISGFTLNFIMFGAEEGERNSSLFRAACDYARCGYSQEDAYDRLTGPSGLPVDEAIRTIRSAYGKVYAHSEVAKK